MRRTLAMILTLAATLPLSGQELTDVTKIPPSGCIPSGAERFGEVPQEPQPDDNTDFTNPLLGFAPRALTPEDEAKIAEETCAPDEPVTPEEPYEKVAAPPPEPCLINGTIVLAGGVRDSYAQPQDPANLTQTIVNAAGITDPARWTAFDTLVANRHFGHAFDVRTLALNRNTRAILTLFLRPLPDPLQGNDTLSVWAHGAASGWGTNLQDLGITVPGQESVVQLDLAAVPTGGSNLLLDLVTHRNLSVVMQDDTAIDTATLTLACRADLGFPPVVGVLRGQGGCGKYPAYDIFLDNEDRRNANDRGGWIGETVSNQNTLLRLCGVPGNDFTNVALKGANFAVVSLSPSCPAGFTRFDRFHDNEDTRPASWDNTPSGSPSGTRGPKKDTNLAFCVATGSPAPTATNGDFPSFTGSYGVFGGRTREDALWALERGWVFLDDEDRNNRNQPANPPRYTGVFLEAGYNTRYFLARVR